MSQRQFGGKADSTPITGINAEEALAGVADCDSHDSGGVWWARVA